MSRWFELGIEMQMALLFITLPVLIRIDVLFKYNMWIYMMLICCYFLLKTLLLKGSCISRYALICQGLRYTHTTAKKSEYLHDSSAPTNTPLPQQQKQRAAPCSRTLSRRPGSWTPSRGSELLRGRIPRLIQSSTKHSGEGHDRPNSAVQPPSGTHTFLTFPSQVHLCTDQDGLHRGSSNASGDPQTFPTANVRLQYGSAPNLFSLVTAGSAITTPFLSHYLYPYAQTYYSNTTCGFI